MPDNTRSPRAGLRRTVAAAGAVALAGALGLAVAPAASADAATYYVDCSAASSTQTGSQAQPFTSLAKASSHHFLAGESLLLKRGTICEGALTIQGSGSSTAWNTLGAYGDAAQPLPSIDGGTGTTNASAVALKNVSYWKVQDLNIAGGYWRGLWIEADQPGVTQHGFQLTGLKVHDQGNRPRIITKSDGSKASDWISGTGSVIVEPCAATAKLEGVTIDDVDAYNGHEVGFQIGHAEKAVYDPSTPGGYNTPDCHMGLADGVLPAKDGVSNTVIRNSGSAYNDASGIWGSGVTNLTMTNNTLHDNGNGKSSTGEPSLLNGEGAWWSNSYNVSATYNTSYANKRGGGDGGGFDADTYATKSLIDHNTAYGNDSYCVAVFGGRDLVTSDVTVTHNTCTDNGKNPSSQSQGDIFTWTAGRTTTDPSSIQNITVNNNTINRTQPGPWLMSQSNYLPGEVSFWGNDITHAVPAKLVYIEQCGTDTATVTWHCDPTQPKLDLNTYKVTGTGPVTFVVARNGSTGTGSAADPYTPFSAYQSATGQDPQSTCTSASSSTC
ncbi:right-handed parallel beta-helix repeat-containing protein [Actinacidiphila alni]|uniref:right-handed parallel beta-helix repeat-containing protein n=1 Tax=Actinacidiphila alni TaxID=380248 RepID=UPI00340AE7CA